MVPNVATEVAQLRGEGGGDGGSEGRSGHAEQSYYELYPPDGPNCDARVAESGVWASGLQHAACPTPQPPRDIAEQM